MKKGREDLPPPSSSYVPVSNTTLALLSGKVTSETIKNNKYLPKSKKKKKKERKKEILNFF